MSFSRKYNVATAAGSHIRIPIVKAGSIDFALSGDWTPVVGDVKISKDGGVQADIGTMPSFVNGMWQFVFTGAELTSKTTDVTITDAATKAIEDQAFVIETYGHASALHPFDLGTVSAPQSVNNDTKISLIPTTPMRGTDNVPTNPALDTDYTALRAAKLDNLDTNILSRNSVTPNTTVPLAANLAATLANQTTIKDRIGAFAGTGVNNILGFFRSLMRSDIVTDPTDIGGTYDSTQHSNQSIIQRGDVGWITGGGGGITDMLNVYPLIPMSVDLADTAPVRLGLMLTNALDDLPSVAEITPGTISIDHKAIGGTAWINVILDVACSEINGLIYFDEVFDSASGYAEGDSLRITFKGQKITVSANDYEIIGATGRFFYTEVRQTVGAGGTSDWNTTEKQNIRSALGVTGTKTTATGGQLQSIPTVTPLDAASTATQAKQDTTQADLDILTGTDGAILATAQANYAPAKAGDAMTVSDKTGFSLSGAGILAIWDRLTSGFLIVGSVGKLIKDFLDATISSRNATPPPSVIDIRTEMDSNSSQLTGIKAKTDTIPIEIRKNAAFNNYPFAMVDLSGNFATGLTVTATKRIDSGSFVPTTNSPVEVGNGVYDINFSQADTNGKAITYRFTATGAKDLLITVIPNP